MDASLIALDPVRLIVTLVGGFVAAQLVGSLIRPLSLGASGNTLAGLLGGLYGVEMAGVLGIVAKPIPGAGGAEFPWGIILLQILMAMAGGAILTSAAGLIRLVTSTVLEVPLQLSAGGPAEPAAAKTERTDTEVAASPEPLTPSMVQGGRFPRASSGAVRPRKQRHVIGS